jgi:membrane protease YdiL (CAAX protease family)
MNGEIIFYIRILLFLIFAIGFELLIMRDHLKIITSIQFAPTLAYILLILLFKNNIEVSIITNLDKRVIIKITQAIILPVLLIGIVHFILKIKGMKIEINTLKENIIGVKQQFLPQLLGATVEEIGWRSFLQTTLEIKHPVLIASIIVGIIWGIWHVVHYMYGIKFMGLFVLTTILLSIIMAIILKDTKNNILISSIFHTSFNLSSLLWLNPSIIKIKTFVILVGVLLIATILLFALNIEYLV